MDKRVIFAVAGSGKTTYIVNKLDTINPILIITYTNNNVDNIRDSIIKKFGYFPTNIKLQPYFTFLHGFCYKPILFNAYNTKGIYFKPNENKFARNDAQFISNEGKIYSNRLAKFLEIKGVLDDVNNRISKYYKYIYIDEIQDFAGNDFNLLKSISKANVNLLMVGDFYQHTFDTSRDGSVNKTLHDNYNNYIKKFTEMGITVDTDTLSKSYRCSPTICKFISDEIGIEIASHRNDTVEISFIESIPDIASIIANDTIVKLFYQKHYAYHCFSRNWGESKGEDRYDNVCVVLNKTTYIHFQKNKLNELNPQTKNKLYVACSRAKKNLFFVSEELIKNSK